MKKGSTERKNQKSSGLSGSGQGLSTPYKVKTDVLIRGDPRNPWLKNRKSVGLSGKRHALSPNKG
jgi:hypothetical protein